MDFPVRQLLTWYRAHQRDLPWRRTADWYAVWVSEVMLQQTQVTTVIPYYVRFMERFPSLTSLAMAAEEEVLKLWEGLGYYSRARNLHRAAREVVAKYGGQIPGDPELFRSLPGVGPYIAAAVCSIAGGIPCAAVDGNVARVYTRFFALQDDIAKTATRQHITRHLQGIIPAESASDFTQALMELGALVCTPQSPSCSSCPFKEDCLAYKTDTVSLFPFKAKRGKVPTHSVSIGIIVSGECFYIQKRPSNGHLGGLWEFPGGKAEPGETPEQTLLRECVEELGVRVQILQELAVINHAYTHFKICLHVFICQIGEQTLCLPQDVQYKWITVTQLDEFPFPGANHKFFPQLRAFFHPVPPG